jgi:hypothetical protein
VRGIVNFDVLAVLVIVNVLATIALWRAAARKPAKLKKKFITALLHSKPIVPKHRSPKIVGDGLTSFVDDEDRQFFNDFAEFANVVNWWLRDTMETPWRLQELPDTELHLDYSDMPLFGRRYEVFYNQVKLGTLEVSPNSDYGAENPNVRTSIQLDWVRLLSIGDIHEFLGCIARHVCERDQTERSAIINGCLTSVLWQSQQIDEYDLEDQNYGELKTQLNGLALEYIERREAFIRRARTRP